VDRLTTLLGHRIAVSSTPGKGTVFRIEGVPWRERPDRPEHNSVEDGKSVSSRLRSHSQ
jgi:hypothetical protein